MTGNPSRVRLGASVVFSTGDIGERLILKV